MDVTMQQPTVKITNNQLLAAMIVASIFVAFYLTITRVDSYIREKGIDNCAHISTYTITVPDDNAVVLYPVVDVYSQCLRDKGISVE